MDTNELAKIARDKKQALIDARANQAPYNTLKALADDYASAVSKWHKAAYPGKRFTKPSASYLIRAL